VWIVREVLAGRHEPTLVWRGRGGAKWGGRGMLCVGGGGG